jgi:hypothetical protein
MNFRKNSSTVRGKGKGEKNMKKPFPFNFSPFSTTVAIIIFAILSIVFSVQAG